MKRWANGLPLSAIQGEVEGSGLGSGFWVPPGPLPFTKVNLDTAGFFPVLSITTATAYLAINDINPSTTITIPKEAGGLYIFNLYCQPNVNHAIQGYMTVKRLVNGSYVDITPHMPLDVYDRTLTGFDYFNPGDILFPFVSAIGALSPQLGRYVFKLARLSV